MFSIDWPQMNHTTQDQAEFLNDKSSTFRYRRAPVTGRLNP